jgi:hypothetical protein
MFTISGSQQRARIEYDGRGRCSETGCRRAATHILCRSSGVVTEVRATCKGHSKPDVVTATGYAQFSIKINIRGEG